MTTTIAVKESTVQLLTKMKKQMEADSLDETIVKILQKVENVPSSRFGSQPKLKKFNEGERAHSHFENKKKIKNWGMSDSIILATAKLLNAKVVTGDEHFRDLDAVMLK